MSAQNSSRKIKPSVGNGRYLPHMQSSLSPQGYGLYNSNGSSNGIEDPTGIASGSSPRLKEHAIPYNDYLIPTAPHHDTLPARGGTEHWNAMGNENFAACTSPGGSHPNGVGENGSVATARGFGGSFPQSQHQPLSHSGPTSSNKPLASYQTLPLLNEPRRTPFNFPAPPLPESTSIMGGSGDHADTIGVKSTVGSSLQNHSANIAKNYYNATPGGNDKANGNQWVMPSMFDAKNSSREVSSGRNPAPSYSSRNDASNFGTPRDVNVPLLKSHIYPNNVAVRGDGGGSSRLDEVEMDRDRKKDRLIDSLSNSDMITCLPGFKKRATVVPQRMKPIRPLKFHEDRFNDKVADQKAQQEMNYNVKSSTPLSTLSSSRGGVMSSSAYARCSPASLSPTLNYKDNAGIVGRGISNQNPALYNINSRSDSRSCRPPSPVTRAKAAIGTAQNEISKIHSYVEEQEEKRRIPGSWQSMGTPFNTEPLTKSAQRQQKAQYRMDLERQILASKMRKAEEERKEKDNNDHPLGPEYAHPALTYYNPPHKIIGSPDQGASVSPTEAAAAITKYIKEKYALDVPGANTNGTTSGYPPETGGSSTALGRIAPLQQAKKEKALANLMKSRVHPKDQNHSSNTSRLLPMNQLQTGGARLHNGMMMHPGNGPKFPQQQLHSQQHQPQTFGQQQQAHASRPQQAGYPQYAYPPPGTYPSRGGGGVFGMPAAWPMPLVPAYAPSPYTPYGPMPNPYGHGQPIYPSANRGPLVNSQPVAQQQNYSHSQQLPPQPHLQQVLMDPRNQQQQRSQTQAYAAYLAQQQNYLQHQNRNGNGAQGELREPHQWNQGAANYPDQEQIFNSRVMDDNLCDDDDMEEFETLKEQTCTNQKIWQTSDELPDPELRTAIYKAELRKQIDEDRKRKAERLAREKEEEERMERKISEFHAEEHQRVAMGQQTRAELEGYHRSKIEKKQKRNEVFTITRNPDRQQNEMRPRSKSSLLAAKLARYRPEAGDFEENLVDANECFNECYNDYGVVNEYNNHDKYPSSLANTITGSIHPLRKSSPPVPVVQKKLIEDLFIASSENRNRNLPHEISFDGQNFLIELKSKLSSERDLVERRLREKLESTKKNMNLLKYTIHQK